MNKFKRDQKVRFKDDSEIYKIIRHYETETGFKYDIMSLNGKKLIISMPENVLEAADEI